MGRAIRAKAVAVCVEVRFPVRTDDLCDGLLNESIHHRRNAQRAGFTIALGNVHTLDRLRAIAARFQLAAQFRPVVFEMVRQFVNGHTVDARRTFVLLYLFQCALQVGAFQHLLQQRAGWNRRR